MSKKLEKIVDKLTDLKEELDAMAEQAQEYYDNRSEKYQQDRR